MKPLLLVILILGAAVAAMSQTTAKSVQPAVEIEKAEWRIIYGPYGELPAPISESSGIRSTSAGGAIAAGSPPMSSAGNGQYYVSNSVSQGDGSKPSRANYQRLILGRKAAVVLRNKSAKSIRTVHLDFIFEDPTTQAEFLRYHFRANKDISAGSIRRLHQNIYLRSKNASRFSPAYPSNDFLERTINLSPRVLITRIEYADGSIWER
jgi:hypothetical protein